jgi:hypothetical protein
MRASQRSTQASGDAPVAEPVTAFWQDAPVIRRLSAIALLLGIGVPLGACGTGGHATAAATARTAPMTATATSAHTSQAPRAPAKPLTRSQAIAFARAVNLTAADVPGFTATRREHKTAAEKGGERELVRCAGALNADEKLLEISSTKFKRGHEIPVVDVSSEVSVARTPALAEKELAAIRGPRARACVSRYLDRLFKGKELRGASISPVSISSGTPPAPGATGSFAWRIEVRFTVHSIQIPLYFDILGFVYGPAQVSLFSTGFATPLPAATQQRLFSLLLQRAKAHDA